MFTLGSSTTLWIQLLADCKFADGSMFAAVRLHRRHQNEGYMNYTRIAWQDHSYAYDNSRYADPPAHKRQAEADGAYKHRKVDPTLLFSGWRAEAYF